jgi:RND family efflux transporter MFP subunit
MAQSARLDSMLGAVRVRVAPVENLAIVPQAEVTGVVAAYRKATVAAEVSGRVLKRQVEPGDTVAEGQVLVALDADRVKLNADQAKAQERARAVRVAQAKQDLERGRRLFGRGAISQEVVDDFEFAVELAAAELQAAKAALGTAQRAERDSQVRAPFAGTAEVVHVQEGDYVNPGMPVVTLTDFSKARVSAGVTASEAATIEPGQAAPVVFEALGGVPVQGVVRSVGRIGDAVSGTYPVEIWIEGEAATRLREGMVGAVRVTIDARAPKPAVPRAALFRQNGQMHAFSVRDGVAHLVPVRTGNGNRTHVEIINGLQAEDLVVVEGQFALRDGAAVQTQ